MPPIKPTIIVSAFALAMLTGGCGSLPPCSRCPEASRPKQPPHSNAASHHVIELNADGFLFDQRPGHSHARIRGREEVARYLDETVFTGFSQSGKKKILVFIHGGLNSRKAGMQHFWDNYYDIL